MKTIYKTERKMKNFCLIKLIFLGIILVCCGNASGQKCDRTPEGSSTKKSPPNGNFRLRVVNDPIRYQPGETYNITLERVLRAGQPPVAKFTGFYIITERDPTDPKQADVPTGELQLGDFEIPQDYASLAKISGKCDHLVAHSSSFLKSDIMVYWKAPPAKSGCVVFKSTVIVVKDVWYSDDGALSFTFCEDDSDSGDILTMPLAECTACQEAKYELTFEGLWSRQTHPKDFPDNGWLTKFSDIIGASHALNFTLWKYGLPASDGLRFLATKTSTRDIEAELKAVGENVRTIIKARGISFPNQTGRTFAVFRVDSKHHLISFVSMMYPSPDWFVGVSGLELCLANGSWVEQKVMNLYPYDAGTDSGPSYISPDQPTIPQEAIRRIRPNQPNDPRSPFHDPEGKDMKPLARLYITRQKLYEMNCEEEKSEEESDRDEDENEDPNDPCATKPWGPWSECDMSCKKTRERTYRNKKLAGRNLCNKELVKEADCNFMEGNCRGGRNNENEDEEQGEDKDERDEENQEENDGTNEIDDPKCQVTNWKASTPCSTVCGKGTKHFTRNFTDTRRFKTCMKKYEWIKLEEDRDCDMEACSGDTGEDGATNEKCEVTDWSDWSQCSVECGYGEKIKVRIPLKNQPQEENLDRIRKLYKKLTIKRRRYADDDGDDEDDDEESDFNVMDISDPNHPCYNTNLVERDICMKEGNECEEEDETPRYCYEMPKAGPNCNGKSEARWFYNSRKGSCGIFTYTGCPSRKNNFLTEEMCMLVCGKNMSETSALISEQTRSHSLIATVSKIDCKMSNWVHHPCNATCGDGLRWRQRTVLQYPKNGGKTCPRKLVHYERCYRECDEPRKSHLASHPNSIVSQHHHQCRYSEWNPWSPCSKTCGDNAVQIRTRTVLNHLNIHLCNERVEERRCEVMPCLVGGGYYNRNYRH